MIQAGFQLVCGGWRIEFLKQLLEQGFDSDSQLKANEAEEKRLLQQTWSSFYDFYYSLSKHIMQKEVG